MLSNISNQLITSISKLFNSIDVSFITYSHLRPLILLVLFIKRWNSLIQTKIPYDQLGLLIFASSQAMSFNDKVATLIQRFKELNDKMANAQTQQKKNCSIT